MSTSSGLIRARGQLTFLIGLTLASAIAIAIELREYVPASDIPPVSTVVHPVPEDALNQWRFIERNYQATTGLVNAEDGETWATLADAGYALKGVLAAHRLNLIDGRELYQRVARMLQTLSALSVEEPFTRLDTRTGLPMAGQYNDAGLEPLMSALELTAWGYPANRAAALAELRRWRQHVPADSRITSSTTSLETATTQLMLAAMAGQGVTK